jgi:hypothetical protein
MKTMASTEQHPQAKRRSVAKFLIKGISRDDPLPLRALLTVGMLVGGLLVIASGLIHLRLWQMAYRHIPAIGPAFLVQGIAGLLIGTAIIGFRRLHKAGIGAGYMAASLGGLLLSTSGMLFGFHESLAAPYVGLSLVIEITGLVLLTAVGVIVARSGRSQRAAQQLPHEAAGSTGERITAESPAVAASPQSATDRPGVGNPKRTSVGAPRPAAKVGAPARPRSGSSSWPSSLSRPSLTAPRAVAAFEATNSIRQSRVNRSGGSPSWSA